MPLSSLWVGHSSLGTGPLHCHLYIQWDFIASRCQLEIDSSSIKDGSPSALGPRLASTCAGPVHTATVSVRSDVCQSCCDRKTLLPWCLPSPSQPPSSEFPAGKGLMKTEGVIWLPFLSDGFHECELIFVCFLKRHIIQGSFSSVFSFEKKELKKNRQKNKSFCVSRGFQTFSRRKNEQPRKL